MHCGSEYENQRIFSDVIDAKDLTKAIGCEIMESERTKNENRPSEQPVLFKIYGCLTELGPS